MARPLKNIADSFPHHCNMRNHPKVNVMRVSFDKGYVFWCMLLEYMSSCENYRFILNNETLLFLCGDFRMPRNEIAAIIDLALELELLSKDGEYIYSKPLINSLYPKLRRRRGSIAKRYVTNPSPHEGFKLSARPEYVNLYLMQVGESSTYKIGYTSKSVKKRLANIRTIFPDIKLIDSVVCEPSYERALHKKYKSKLADNGYKEYFNLSPEDVKLVLDFFKEQKAKNSEIAIQFHEGI